MKINPFPLTAGIHAPVMQPAATPLEPVLLIHGTFSNSCDAKDQAKPWWASGSEFCGKLDQALGSRRSPARTWGVDEFAWTGKNLESERRKAGWALASQLRELEKLPTVQRYHIVAHSHGGNVVLNALREVNPRRLGCVIFLGTPFLTFRDSKPRFTTKGVAHAFYVIGLVLSSLGIKYMHSLGWGFVIAFACCIVIACAEAASSRAPLQKAGAFSVGQPATASQFGFRPALSPVGLRDSVYGSGQPSVFLFKADEAVHGLKHVASMANEPRKFFHQFFAAPRNAVPWVAPREAPRRSRFSDLNTMPHVRLLRTFVNIEGTQGGLVLRGTGTSQVSIPIAVTPQTWEETVAAFVRNIPPFNFFAPIVLGVIYVAIVAPFLIFELFVSVCKFIASIVSGAFKRFVLSVGPNFTAEYLAQKAFGLDEGLFQTCEVRPPGVWIMEKISPELDEKISAESRATGGSAGAALSGALAQAGSYDIRRCFEELFTNPELAHTRYYREQEIIDAIADKIAAIQTSAFQWTGLKFPGLTLPS